MVVLSLARIHCRSLPRGLVHNTEHDQSEISRDLARIGVLDLWIKLLLYASTRV